MKAIPLACMFLAISGPLQVAAMGGDGGPSLVSQWEYRVLKKEHIIDLGKKDLAAGLNKLGGEGWELVAVDGDYVFKRPKDLSRLQIEDIKGLIVLLENDVERVKERVAWSERMLKKGFLSKQQVEGEQAELKRAQFSLDRARRQLKALPSEPEKPAEEKPKPDK
jgi:hypothetical protein